MGKTNVINPFYFVDKDLNVCHCKLTIQRDIGLAMVTQLHTNKGGSVTNNAGNIARNICLGFSVPTHKLLLLERWSEQESYGREGNECVCALLVFRNGFNHPPEMIEVEEDYINELFEILDETI